VYRSIEFESNGSGPVADPGSTTTRGFALFETPIGTCGIAWGPDGLLGIQLPDVDGATTRACLVDQHPDAPESKPPRAARAAIDGIDALLRGDALDLLDVALDMSGVSAFHRRVYETARTIPVGETTTYGELAVECGSPGAARAVGQALGRNPFAIVVPCHRVTSAGGKVGGFSAHGGVRTKLRLLELEGTTFAS
jgi:methylated-DNA-[protein]-cysteine S-methyltransferase